jgi:hypothetical protein
MTPLNIKTSLHQLIDSIDDEAQLNKAYQVIETLSILNEEGALWAKLSPEQQKELLEVEEESHNPESLTAHEEMMKRHKKWL